MKKSKKAISILIGAMISFHVQASDLFITVNSGNSITQGAAMVLANQALEQKNSVRVLLCGEGASIALNTKEQAKLKPKNVTAQQMMQALMKSGATVEVCALYLPNSGHSISDLSDGVKVAKPSEVAKHMTSPEVKILSF